MSIMYCEYCDAYIDSDFDTEHFNGDNSCIQQEIDQSTKEFSIIEDEHKIKEDI